MKGEVKIDVFITKTFKFKARIKEKGKRAYKVTLNGEQWIDGRGREHATAILRKAERLNKKLEDQLWSANFHNRMYNNRKEYMRFLTSGPKII